MINVANGISRVQVNSTSLQNYANADRIGTLVDQTLAMGVPASKITVLVYYTGQLSLVSHKIQATAEANGRNGDLSAGNQISSVDSFQGEENDFVFVDLVVAHQRPEKTSDAVKDEESEDDDGSEGFRRSGRVTAHVKSGNRLCCALTRGRSCVVVVCQLAALLSTVKAKQKKGQAAVSAMARDFEERKLVYNDYTSLDTSPIGQAQRATWTEARLAVELKRQKAESLDFLNTQYKKVKKARYNEEFQDTAPQGIPHRFSEDHSPKPVWRRRRSRGNLQRARLETIQLSKQTSNWTECRKKPCALCPRLPPEPIAMPGPKFLRPFIELTYFLIK